MVVESIIVVGLILIAYLNWTTYKGLENVESIVGNMLYDLGKQGILKVNIREADEDD